MLWVIERSRRVCTVKIIVGHGVEINWEKLCKIKNKVGVIRCEERSIEE